MTHPAGGAAGRRIRLTHHRFELADGRKVGLSVGGSGVPLVFFHGIGMNRRVYLRLLSRLSHLGFLVVAFDAPGHGETFTPVHGQRSFVARMAATNDILDALGIERALLVGHSMGGRTVAELAAMRPERAFGAVLINAALGETFDAARSRSASPVDTASGLLSGVLDMVHDRVGLRRLGVLRHFGMLGSRSLTTVAHPRLFMSAAKAIVWADRSAHVLQVLRESRVPVAVVHGERDMVVPLESAIGVARVVEATLVTLPNAYHSWVLPSPWTFVQILDQLISRGNLGTELLREVDEVRRKGSGASVSARWLTQNSRLLELVSAVSVIGRAQPRNDAFYHPYRIWESADTL